MVVGRVLRPTTCPSCRVSIVRSFTSLAGPQRTWHLSAKPQYSILCPRQRYSSFTAQDDGTSHETRGSQSEDVEEKQTQDDDPPEAPPVPWYLQVDTPQRNIPPLSRQQSIPELPESPPPILEPLLQQISVDLGLDNLSLLDLRKLDPPPALGANLLMLIGTARSEKHLHVSADRLCRWLRSTYKLRPDADGLLGRNELKLKLKRKSRRAKMLGSAADDNGDDGVRTGWVCVDVGVVEDSSSITNGVPAPEDFVGFGPRTTGTRIVIQLLIEEKREEIDLERLWLGILERGSRSDTDGTNQPEPSHSVGLPEQGQVNQMSRRPSPIISQSRGFHTTARHPSADEEPRPSPVAEPSLYEAPTSTSEPGVVGLNSVKESVMLSITSSNFDAARNTLLQYSKDIPELQNSGLPFFLKQLRFYIEGSSKFKAVESLGAGPFDQSSTPFLISFYQTVSALPPKSKGEALIWLYCYAVKIGHDGYRWSDLMDLVTRLQVSGIMISPDYYLRLVQCALRPVAAPGNTDVERRSKQDALKILQSMHDQGHKVLSGETFLVLQKSTAPDMPEPVDTSRLYSSSSGTYDLPSLPMSPLRHRIHACMKAVKLPLFQEETRLQLLDLYSKQHHWLEFWDIWRMTARQGKPQSPRLYAFMFKRVAETMNQKACMTVLRTWIPEMDLEVPQVMLEGDVAESVKAILKVVDPYVEQDAASDNEAKSEWVALWHRMS